MSYAKDVLVETDWVAEHLGDDSVRIVEVDENPNLYSEGHIPGAIGFDWRDDLQDQVHRRFEFKLCRPCQAKFLANPLGRPRGTPPTGAN